MGILCGSDWWLTPALTESVRRGRPRNDRPIIRTPKAGRWAASRDVLYGDHRVDHAGETLTVPCGSPHTSEDDVTAERHVLTEGNLATVEQAARMIQQGSMAR